MAIGQWLWPIPLVAVGGVAVTARALRRAHRAEGGGPLKRAEGYGIDLRPAMILASPATSTRLAAQAELDAQELEAHEGRRLQVPALRADPDPG